MLETIHSIKADFKVAEVLASLAPRFPEETIACIKLMVEGEKRDWAVYADRDHIIEVIRIAWNSERPPDKTAARDVVDILVGRGHFGYRDLLH